MFLTGICGPVPAVFFILGRMLRIFSMSSTPYRVKIEWVADTAQIEPAVQRDNCHERQGFFARLVFRLKVVCSTENTTDPNV